MHQEFAFAALYKIRVISTNFEEFFCVTIQSILFIQSENHCLTAVDLYVNVHVLFGNSMTIKYYG